MRCRLLPILTILSLAACQGLQSGSGDFVAPKIESADASFNVWGIVLQCHVDIPRVDRCGFLVGPVGETKSDYPAVLSGNTFSVTLHDLAPERTYEWEGYIEAGKQRILSKSATFKTPGPPPADYVNCSFKDYIPQYDLNEDGYLAETELSSITTLTVPTDHLQDMKGLEYCVNLESLTCTGSPGGLTWLDVTMLPRLTYLNCDGNKFGIVSGDEISDEGLMLVKYNSYVITESHLQTLSCNNAGLRKFYVGYACELRDVSISGNQITYLDLMSAYSRIEKLDCSDNLLTDINLEISPLKELDCSRNRLKSLRISEFQHLTMLKCAPMNDEKGNNLLEVLYLPKGTHIPHITENRSEEYIPAETRIEFYDTIWSN